MGTDSSEHHRNRNTLRFGMGHGAVIIIDDDFYV